MTRTGQPQRPWQLRIVLGVRRIALGVRLIVLGGWQLARRIAGVVAECSYAQRRLAALRGSPDRYLPDPDRAPETYQEFLFRTSGPLVHELAAARRSAGRAVR